MVLKYDHIKPSDLERWLNYVDMSEEEFDRIADTFRDEVWSIKDNCWFKENINKEMQNYGEVKGYPKWHKVRLNMQLKEHDIRPAELDEGKIKALEEDLERLHANIDDFVEVNCPACSSSSSIFEFEKYGFKFERCTDCQTVYMNPRATPEILDDFYSNSRLYAYWDKYIFPASRSTRMQNIFRPRVEYINDLCKKENIETNLIVEIGSASGMFCEEATKSNHFKRVLGIEPSSDQVETCRQLGLEVIESTIENVKDLDQTADIVVSFETIEHISSPSSFILSARNIFKKEGLMVLTCPNYLGFDILCMGKNSDSLDAEHINMFNPDSLRLLVENSGFSST